MSAAQTWLGREGGCASCPSRLGATGNSCRLWVVLTRKRRFSNRLQVALVHEPTNPGFAAADPVAPQLVLDAPAAVGLATLHEKQADLLGQTGVLLPAATLRFLSLSVKPAATEAESRAEFLNRVAILGMHLADYLEAFQG